MGKQAQLRKQRRQEGFEKLQRERERVKLFNSGTFYDRVMQFEKGDFSDWMDRYSCIVIDGGTIPDSLSKDILPVSPLLDCRPPFQSCFVEWNSPIDEPVADWLWGVVFGFWGNSADEDYDNGQQTVTGNVSVYWWSPYEPKPACNFECQMWIYYNSETGQCQIDLAHEGRDELLWHDAIMRALHVFQFMNCRNVQLVDHAPEPSLSQRYEREFGVPMTTYKTLRIKPVRKQYESDDSESEAAKAKKRLHIVRGHIATYTDDAPLFGKYVGQYWIPAHVRGDEQRGMVVKDYEVEAPQN